MFKTTHKAIQAHKRGFKIINDSIQGMRTKPLKTNIMPDKNIWDNMTEAEKYAQDQDREQENEYQDNLNLV